MKQFEKLAGALAALYLMEKQAMNRFEQHLVSTVKDLLPVTPPLKRILRPWGAWHMFDREFPGVDFGRGQKEIHNALQSQPLQAAIAGNANKMGLRLSARPTFVHPEDETQLLTAIRKYRREWDRGQN